MKTRTKYPKSIKRVDETKTVFKRGQKSKLGFDISVGDWKGMPIYNLTLEERVTCPKDCEQWDICYGDNMPFAHRIDHTDPSFYDRMNVELNIMDVLHIHGYVIRLHVLGDFFSKEYIVFWLLQLLNRKALRIWGYTHNKRDTELGKMIAELNETGKAFIRYSDDHCTSFNTRVKRDPVWSAHKKMNNKFKREGKSQVFPIQTSIPKYNNQMICPEQVHPNKYKCANCGACWNPKLKENGTTIVFLQH